MNWPRVQLKQITALGPQYGANASGATWTGSRPRYIRITDIDQYGRLLEQGAVEADTEDVADYTLEEGDLLFARSGNTVGKTYRHSRKNDPSVFAGYLIRFRLDSRLADSRFVFFYTQSPSYKTWVSSKKRVAGQPNLNGSEYSTLTFPLPALREQQRIVEILVQADALRQKRAEADALGDSILPALFHKLFGDPATNPKGWPRVRLGTILADTRNGLYKHADFYGRGTQILKMFNILNGRLNLSRIDRVELDAQELAAYRLEAGDILVNRVNTPELVGKCAVISAELGEAVFESKNIRLRLNTNVAEPTYVAHFLSSSFGHATLCQGLKHAIGMATINNSDVRNCLLPLPPIKNQLEWAAHVASVREVASNTDSSGSNLEQLFRALLHRAFTGELTAQWREAHMKELLVEMEQQARLLRSNPNGRN